MVCQKIFRLKGKATAKASTAHGRFRLVRAEGLQFQPVSGSSPGPAETQDGWASQPVFLSWILLGAMEWHLPRAIGKGVLGVNERVLVEWV